MIIKFKNGYQVHVSDSGNMSKEEILKAANDAVKQCHDADNYQIVKKFKDLYDGRTHAIVYRPNTDDYLIALGYDESDGTWGQGRYDFKSADDAEIMLKGQYDVEEIGSTKDSCIKDEEETEYNFKFSIYYGGYSIGSDKHSVWASDAKDALRKFANWAYYEGYNLNGIRIDSVESSDADAKDIKGKLVDLLEQLFGKDADIIDSRVKDSENDDEEFEPGEYCDAIEVASQLSNEIDAKKHMSRVDVERLLQQRKMKKFNENVYKLKCDDGSLLFAWIITNNDGSLTLNLSAMDDGEVVYEIDVEIPHESTHDAVDLVRVVDPRTSFRPTTIKAAIKSGDKRTLDNEWKFLMRDIESDASEPNLTHYPETYREPVLVKILEAYDRALKEFAKVEDYPVEEARKLVETIRSHWLGETDVQTHDVPYLDPTNYGRIDSDGANSVDRLLREVRHANNGSPNYSDFDGLMQEIDELVAKGADFLTEKGWSKDDARHAIDWRYGNNGLLGELKRKFYRESDPEAVASMRRQLSAAIKRLEKAWNLTSPR